MDLCTPNISLDVLSKKKKYQFGCMKYARKKKSPGLNGLNVSFQTIYA